MIAPIASLGRAVLAALLAMALSARSTAASDSPAAAPPGTVAPVTCLSTGDGYLRARLAGAIEADIDWPNSGTHCAGSSRDQPEGVRLSFDRPGGATPDLLFVFGINGVRAGQPGHALGVNLTLIVQGSSRVFGTLGATRCTIDSLNQRQLPAADTWRVEARGFCTQPAHAVHGDDDVLVSRFDFAGVVSYARDEDSE